MNRIARLRAVMAAQGIDATVLVPGSNLQYLAGIGFTTKLRLSCLVVPLSGTPVLVVPTMEGARAQAVANIDLEVIGWDDGPGPQAAVAQALARHQLHVGTPTIAVEHVVMRVFELRAVEAATPHARIVNADPVIAQLRMRKDDAELTAMRKAVVVAETTLAQAIAAIRPGMSELAVAALWEDAIRAAGSEPSFGIAVGSGPNGASPHHSNGSRPLQAGDLVSLTAVPLWMGTCRISRVPSPSATYRSGPALSTRRCSPPMRRGERLRPCRVRVATASIVRRARSSQPPVLARISFIVLATASVSTFTSHPSWWVVT